MKNQIKDLWKSYESMVVPKNASSEQRVETRRAFYAGVAGFNSIMIDGLENDTEDGWMQTIESIQEELAEFVYELKKSS